MTAVPLAPRDDEALAAAREAALARWQLMLAEAVDDQDRSREERLDLDRRREARLAVQKAVEARAAAVAEQALRSRPVAVLVHRNDWLREKLAAALEGLGLAVVASVGDGAEGMAAVIVEQPDVVLAEDLLPSISGADLLAHVRAFAPSAVVAVHAVDEVVAARFVESGAQAAWSRRVPPAEIARGLAELVATG